MASRDPPASPPIRVRPLRLRDGVMRGAFRRMRASGEIVFAAAPSMIEEYTQYCGAVFAAMGRGFDAAEMAHLRERIVEKLELARRARPRRDVVVRYRTDENKGIVYAVRSSEARLEDAYDEWSKGRELPLFGAHPDAIVMETARAIEAPQDVACLDVGAGDGRNALALARTGFWVDAIEPSALGDTIDRAAREESLAVRVLRTDVLDTELEAAHYALVIASEVTSHFLDAAELRAFFERIAPALAPGGALVVNAFVAKDDYVPDPVAREISTSAWSTFYTRAEITAATEGLGLRVALDEAVIEYEKARQPVWPPTKWYEGWARGEDLFGHDDDGPAIELRWIVLRKG